MKNCRSNKNTVLYIPGSLASLNQYINAERTNRYKAASMKKRDQDTIAAHAKHQLRGIKSERVFLQYRWYEKNTRRDWDNVTGYGHKVIQDALVQAGIIVDDNQKHVCGFSDQFFIDKAYPHIEVRIIEL